MKNFLAISWAFPPIIQPRSLQVSRTLRSLRASGWQASVLMVDPRSIQRTFKSDPALGAEYEGLFPITAVPSPEDFLGFRAIWRVFPDLSLMPDPRSVWIPFALAAGRRLLSSGKMNGIISFAQPWSDHIIARRLSRDFHLPWIAHFSDPWIDSPYYHPHAIAESLRRTMERQVVQEADAVIFVSNETRDLVMRKYPSEWAKRAHVIPHCYEPLTLPAAGETQPQSGQALRLVYTGGFYGRRTPENLFKVLAAINREERLAGRLELEIVGSGGKPFKGMLLELGLEDIVTITPLVPYQESQMISAGADVLLVIDAPSSDVNVFLPSKLVEYLAFRKPIFGITPLKGATAGLLRELDCPLADTEDLEGIAAVLKSLMRKKQSGELGISPAFDETAARYDIRETTRQYLELCETLFRK